MSLLLMLCSNWLKSDPSVNDNGWIFSPLLRGDFLCKYKYDKLGRITSPFTEDNQDAVKKIGKKKAAKRLLVLNSRMTSSQIDYLVIKDTGITILEGVWIDIK